MFMVGRLYTPGAIGSVRAPDETLGGAEGLPPEGGEANSGTVDESLVGEQDAEGLAQSASLSLIRGGAETGEVFTFVGSAVIGRFDPAVGPIDVDLGGIDEGAYVSRKHARISYQDGAWVVEDLGSSNGTFVLEGDDFRRIEEPTRIENGATVVFGNARFVFRIKAAEESDSPEAPSDER